MVNFVFGEVFDWTLIIGVAFYSRRYFWQATVRARDVLWLVRFWFCHGDVMWGGVTFCGRDFCHDDVL
jgi:hypothetical protein